MIGRFDNHESDGDEKRVLIIACAFPPTGGAGVQRTLKFAKYLRNHGWTPIVWSAPTVPHLPLDPSLCDELPSDVEHLTCPTLDPVGRSARIFAPLIRMLSGFPRLASKMGGLEWRVATAARRCLDLAIPDSQFFWALRSYFRLRRVIRTKRVSAIFSSYSPASNHLLAYWLKRSTGIPWIADFRDLWTDDARYPVGSRVRPAVDRWLERRFVRAANAVTATTEVQRDRLAEKVPDQPEKFHVISNGVDFDDIDRAARLPTRRDANGSRKTFRLVFAGQFQSTSVSDDYFSGIGRFLTGDAERAKRFEFRIVGLVSAALRKAAERHGVEIATTGYVSHIEAVREMMDADVLLLPVPLGTNAAWCVPSKIFEYLATERPILLVGSDTAMVSRIVTGIRDTPVTPCNAEAIAEAIQALWTHHLNGDLSARTTRDALAPFDRNALTGQLADLLDEIAHQPRRAHHKQRTTVMLLPPRPRIARHKLAPIVQPFFLSEKMAR